MRIAAAGYYVEGILDGFLSSTFSCSLLHMPIFTSSCLLSLSFSLSREFLS